MAIQSSSSRASRLGEDDQGARLRREARDAPEAAARPRRADQPQGLLELFLTLLLAEPLHL